MLEFTTIWHRRDRVKLRILPTGSHKKPIFCQTNSLHLSPYRLSARHFLRQTKGCKIESQTRDQWVVGSQLRVDSLIEAAFPSSAMPDPSLLETFVSLTDSPFVIEHIAEEFTSRCPMTGHPDFGQISLRYEPRPASAQGLCVELKSLKLYYQSFRDEGIFYEAVTNRIRDDLVTALDPTWLQIISHWRGRGGIRSIIRADFGDIPSHHRGR